MGKWMDAFKNMPNEGFVSFGSSTTAHFPEKNPSEGGFVSFGSSTMAHFNKIAETEIRREGIRRLKVAAYGLPLDFAELQAFFDDDIHDFGSGGVSPAGIRKACEWFASVYPLWRTQQ